MSKVADRVRQAASHANWAQIAIGGTLVGLTAVAFALRASGARFGLPDYVYHPDEPAIVERAAAMLRTGNLNPKWFDYPSGYLYVQLLTQILYVLVGATRGLIGQVPQFTLPQFYFAGRLTTAFLGTILVPVAYLTAKKAHSTRAGVIAAALVAFSYLNVVHSHYATTDIAASLAVALCTLFSLLILQRGEMRWYVLAGIAAGFAAGMKYTAGLVLLMLLLAHILRTKWGEWGWIDRRIVGGLLAAAGAFLLTTPYALLDLPTFLNGLAFEVFHYHDFQPGYSGASGLWYLRAMLTSADAPLAVAYWGGILYAVVRPSRIKLLLLAMPAIFFLGLATTAVHFERNLLPILPALAVLSAVLIADASTWIGRHIRRKMPGWMPAAALTVLAVVLPFGAALSFDRSLTEPDMRTVAGQWVAQNVPAGSKIAIEHYSIPFSHEPYQVTDVMRAWDHDADWYAEQGFDYVIVSSGVWLVMADQPARYQRELGILHDLETRYELVAEFQPQRVPALAAAGYPTIRDYHFPTVWIIRVREP